MSDSLGQHLIIDLYACFEESISSPLLLQEALTHAMEMAQQPIDEISAQVLDDEIILSAIALHCHVTLHAYPLLGYVAADVYSFQSSLQATTVMKSLKTSFGADRVRATSVRRANFGSEQDMKPRRKNSLSTLGRVTRTRTRLKNTGSKLKSKGAHVFQVIRNKNKHE